MAHNPILAWKKWNSFLILLYCYNITKLLFLLFERFYLLDAVLVEREFSTMSILRGHTFLSPLLSTLAFLMKVFFFIIFLCSISSNFRFLYDFFSSSSSSSFSSSLYCVSFSGWTADYVMSSVSYFDQFIYHLRPFFTNCICFFDVYPSLEIVYGNQMWTPGVKLRIPSTNLYAWWGKKSAGNEEANIY